MRKCFFGFLGGGGKGGRPKKIRIPPPPGKGKTLRQTKWRSEDPAKGNARITSPRKGKESDPRKEGKSCGIQTAREIVCVPEKGRIDKKAREK